MSERPVRHRRRNGNGAHAIERQASPAGYPRRYLRRRKRKKNLPCLIRAAALRCQQLTSLLIAWVFEYSRPPGLAFLRCSPPPPRRRRNVHRRRRMRWKVGVANDGWRKSVIARCLNLLAYRGAALLTVCGIVMLVVGCRGIWNMISDVRQSQKTEEAVLAMYEPEERPDEAEIPAEEILIEIAEQETEAISVRPPEEAKESRAFYTLEGRVRLELATLVEANSDLVGWLCIDQIINQPVLYRDNVYYETHDFYGNESVSGAIFLDYCHRLTPETQNVLLHGHNMKDGTMFGMLLRYYKDGDFLRKHGIVHFDTLYEEGVYAIFAVLDASLNRKDDRYFDYFSHARFRDADELNAYIAAVRERSLYDIPIDINPEDAFLTLSTCLGEDRLVILARRLREGETEADMCALLAGSRTRI